MIGRATTATFLLLAVAATPAFGADAPAGATRSPTLTTIAPPPAPPQQPGSYADPLSALGASSPTCRSEVSVVGRRNCRSSGAVQHRYPLSSYGFDVQVGFSITHMQDSFLGALQSIAALIWMALVYLVKGVMLLLEWAFSLDLLSASMASVRRTMAVLHERVIGEPWFLAALSVVAVWGIWRGLVQRRATETIGALAATVGLMLCALVVLARPDDTVGYASHLVNDASIGVLAAATGGDVDHPRRALADAMIGVFDSTVRDPWCALEFGSVNYCHKRAKRASGTNADVWLAYPAGSGERKSLYKLLKGEELDTNSSVIDTLTSPITSVVGIENGKDSALPGDVRDSVVKEPARARMQEAGGTFPRFALLSVIAVGITGAIALLGYLGIRLLLAAILALLLLLLAPAMLLAPAFGDSGRATFVAWVKRLVGAIVAKLIYAVFLAIVLAGAAALRAMDIGWFGTWLLQIAFWWGVLIKRHELIGFVSVGSAQDHRSGAGSVLARAYYAAQLGRAGRAVVRGTARRPAAAVGRVAETRREHADARTAATAAIASERLDAQAAQAVVQRQTAATQQLVRRDSDRREIRALDRQLAGLDEARAAARAEGVPEPLGNDQQAAMLARRRALRERLADPEMRAAEQVRLRAERTQAQTGEPVGPQDTLAYRQRRARELRADLPVDDPRHLRAAGIDPDDYARAQPAERDQLRERVIAHVDEERALHDAADGRRGELRIDPRELRRRTAAQRERARREHKQRRARANVFRGR